MRVRGILLFSSMCTGALCPLAAQAFVAPTVYELTPASGLAYSVALGVSPDGTVAVGVSSADPISISAGKIITPSSGQTFVATTWSLTSLPTSNPYAITGSTVSELSSVSAALYGASSLSGSTHNYVGTKFTGTTGTNGFYDNAGVIDNFTASGTNSYGFSIGGVGGAAIGTGWASSGGTNLPCVYIVTAAPGNSTTGLVTIGSAAGIAYAASTPGGILGATYYEAGLVGSVGSNAAAWSMTYTGTKNHYTTGPTFTAYTGLPTSATATAIEAIFDTQNVAPDNYAMGGSSFSTDSFLYTVPTSGSPSYASAILGIPYAMISTAEYVGTNSDGAFSSNAYPTYGSLYSWLDGFHWGATTPGGPYPYQAYGIGNWTSLDNAFGEAYISSAFYYTVGNGVSTAGDIGYMALYEAPLTG